MKRHPGLQRLSSDHHRALVLAKRLRAAAQDVAGDSLQELALTAVQQWRDEVAPHFIAEEEQLLPLFARFSAPDHPLIIETLRQHVLMRSLLDAIMERLATGEEQDSIELRTLGDALRDHVRFEENELFPVVEASLPAAQLMRLQQRLAAQVC